MVRTRYVPESETYRNFGFRLNRIIPCPSIDLELGLGLSGVLVVSIYILRALGLRPPRSRMSVEVGGPDSTLVQLLVK